MLQISVFKGKGLFSCGRCSDTCNDELALSIKSFHGFIFEVIMMTATGVAP